MQCSMMWFLHIAQVSTTISQAQRATAFHFLVSKRLIFLDEEDEGETENNGPAVPDPSPAGITVMSMSMAQKERVSERKLGVRALFA